MEKTLPLPRRRTLFCFLAPGISVFCFSLFVPLCFSIYYSFLNWGGGSKIEFIGLDNFTRLLADRNFGVALKNNITIVLFCLVGQVGISFLLASVFMSKVLRSRDLLRTVIFFPVLLSPVVLGVLWFQMYNFDYGLINSVFRAVGLERLATYWLDEPHIAIYAVAVPMVWQYIGFFTVIFLAARQGIDNSLYEAAEIDGASGWAQMRFITMPLLSSTIKVTVMLCISGNMKVFDHIYVMTGGGPGTSTLVMAQYAYKSSFTMLQFGYGSAISVGIMVISLVLIGVTRKLLGGDRDA